MDWRVDKKKKESLINVIKLKKNVVKVKITMYYHYSYLNTYRRMTAITKVIEGAEFMTADRKEADVNFMPNRAKH